MVDLGINGVVLRTKSNTLGDVGSISVMGKTLDGWAAACMSAPVRTLDVSPVVNFGDKLRELVDRKNPITVVLYNDAPLVSHKTVESAVNKLIAEKSKMLALPRGFVFKTEYLADLETLYMQEPADTGEFSAVTDGESLSRITELVRRRILRYHARNGVRIADMYNTYIDCDVVIARGVTVEPNNFIKGKTIIKDGAAIMPGNYIEDCLIGSDTRIDSSRLYGSSIGSGTRVGPFAYVRPDSVVGKNCRIGDFVELKCCVIGDGCKVSHLSYIGDAELGKDCNVGCGVVFANYDGKNKYKSVIGNRVFIGSNANIVAPVNIADRAFIAAGSTITKGVPEQALAIARARQTMIANWQGNKFAPPPVEDPRAGGNARAFGFVQFSDGIIDGTASAAHNDGTEAAEPEINYGGIINAAENRNDD